jgi:uncharacterized protein (DUF1015 family)
MATIKAFNGLRPVKELASQVAALPYDVYDRAEAVEAVKGKEYTFLRIDRAETQFDDSMNIYDEQVYAKAKELLEADKAKGVYKTDLKKCYYIYELTMDGRTQTGIVACASIDDYVNGVIKKHENTREDKEQDRIHHVDTVNAQTGPIFLAYRENKIISKVIEKTKNEEPIFDFTAEDGIKHRGFVIDKDEDIKVIEDEFDKINDIYIADGHHRAASAVKVGLKRRDENKDYNGSEEFNYFLSVLFQEQELMIMSYNRVVHDLNGMTDAEFLQKLSKDFSVEEKGEKAYAPCEKAEFGMYLNGKWYSVKASDNLLSEDVVKGLDVSILQDNVLGPMLGIEDPRTDKRIEFVGGIKGLEELKVRADKTKGVAFSMYATTIQELFGVADAKRLMPPKSTWFEPKLRSGLFIHELDK